MAAISASTTEPAPHASRIGEAAGEVGVPTRERILYAGAELFRRQGYAATGLKQIAAEAEAPMGSIYYLFPKGKEQLAAEVLRVGGRFFQSLYEGIAEQSKDLPATVEAFFAGAGETLLATDYADACPIATVAGEVASTNEALRQATAGVFESWVSALVDDAMAVGIEREPARELALSVLAVLEGSFLLSRSLRSIEPMTAGGRSASHLVAAAMGGDRQDGGE